MQSQANSRIRRVLGIGVSEFSDGRWVTMYSNGQSQKARLLGKARPVPSVLCLEQNYEQTAAFLAGLRSRLFEIHRRNGFQVRGGRAQRRAMGKGPPAIWGYSDFTMIDEISPEVALVIAAEYNRFHRGGGWIPQAIDLGRRLITA